MLNLTYHTDIHSSGEQRSPEYTFNKLYRKHHARVRRQAAALTGCPALSYDVMQEVFLRLWMKIDTVDEIKCIETWLYTVTRNCSLDCISRRKRDQDMLKDYGLEQDERCWQESSVNLKAIYEKAIEQLPPRQRMAYLLKQEKNWRREDIAASLQVSRHTVKNQVQTASDSIRKFIKEKVAA